MGCVGVPPLHIIKYGTRVSNMTASFTLCLTRTVHVRDVPSKAHVEVVEATYLKRTRPPTPSTQLPILLHGVLYNLVTLWRISRQGIEKY